MNSVNYENGKKFHQSANEMAQAKEYSNQLCQVHGISTTEVKAQRNCLPEWKRRLKYLSLKILKISHTKEDFIRLMEMQGYKVKWEDKYKYVTFTTSDNNVCRDAKLFDERLLKESMEKYFELGGCNSLVAEKYHAYRPELNQKFGELMSLLDMFMSSNQRHYHQEHIHHSDAEIEKMLAQGLKISSDTVVTVIDDEDEEYEQNHGFGLMM